MLIKILRNVLGFIIVFLDWVTRPKAMARSANEQEKAQSSLQGHSLYQHFACPFCVKTRRAIHHLGVSIEVRNINEDPNFRVDLQNGGGRVKTPCLRIDEGNQTRWIYESKDIITYLRQRVSRAT